MKHILAVAVLVLFAQVAHADWCMKVKTGQAYVFEQGNMQETKTDFCTEKSYGPFCVGKAEIVGGKPYHCPDGTDPLEIGTADTGSLKEHETVTGADEYANQTAKRKKELAAEDKKRAKERAWRVKLHGEEKVQQMERAGNSNAYKP